MDERLSYIKGPRGHLASVIHESAPNEDSPRRLVILAHGFTGTKCESGRLFVTTARALAAAGINALRFDFFGSGDSEGEFYQMTPNTEIDDLHAVIRWATKRFESVGVLGLSMGGGVSICTVADAPNVKALVTWSSVPDFSAWKPPEGKRIPEGNPISVGPAFFTDRPERDIPESYRSIRIPKLQIQGDRDMPGFLEGFRKFFPDAPSPKRHVVIKGADHTFNTWKDRKRAINLTVEWFLRYL